ncbi:hypothetical protein J0A71_08g16760 [Encephalitozoon cuniculi]|nr:hypothetical protein J0A71_08g16760 [Encephalitozoon cuniculi]
MEEYLEGISVNVESVHEREQGL